jgi:hypothetical protein
MGKFNDLTGQTFGRLTALSVSHNKNKQWFWKFFCVCGKVVIRRGSCVKSGHTKSCGCLNKDVITKHKMNGSPEHKIWAGLKQRCLNKLSQGYENYGGRGITVCQRWQESFENFFEDMGPRPSKNHSIERIDNDGPYSPENCKWATIKEQSKNKRPNKREIWMLYNGEKKSLGEWAKIAGLSRHTVYCRLFQYNWRIEDVLNPPSKNRWSTASDECLEAP